MSNIFQERDESKLIKDRKVQPVKGNPVQQPTPPQPEPAAPQPQAPAQEPQQQPQAEVAPQPEAPQPVDYAQYYSAPIPFMPPVGYAGVQSNPNAFQAQYQLLDALQTPEVQQGRLDPIIPLLQQNVVTNPGVTSLADVSDDLNEKAERWTNDWTSSVNKSHQSYKNYVTHNNVGVNPATQFNASGKPIRRATETEIRTGLNGLMSELGTSLRNNFDKDNWFTGSIQTMKGLVPMVGNVLKSIPGIGGFVQVADILTEKFLGEDAVKNADPMIGDAKRAMYQLAHGNVGEANKILQNSPVQTNWDYGKGLTGLAFYALSLPENLVAAGVYEYADGWRQFMDNRDKRGFTQNFTAGLQAAAGTIQMFEPELDNTRNRFGQVLRGKSLGTFQRWTEDKYLSMQEPAGVEMGTIINNPYFDLPENLIKAYNLLPTPDIDTTKGSGFWTQAMLHNVTQGIPAFMIEMLADAPADFLVGSLWKAGKALDGIDLLPNRVSGLVEAGEDVPFIQTRPVGQLALPGTVEVPGVDEYRASIMTVDVEARTVGDYPMVADPWDVTPNPNKAQTTLINLDSEVPRTVPSVDLDYVRRSNEDLARLANRMGILVEPTPEGVDALMRQDPQQFARYGKPIHPEIENFNGVQVNGEVVPVANVYPISLTPPDAPPSLEDLTAAGNLMSDAAEDIKDALRTGNDPSSALVLYKKAESDFVVARDGLPPDVAYKENVHNLPSELVTQKPEALEAGINYVSNLVEAEQTNRVVKQLVNEYEQLDGVEQLIDTKLRALPDVGYEDMHDIQAVMGQNGMDDMMNNPIARDVPEPQALTKGQELESLINNGQDVPLSMFPKIVQDDISYIYPGTEYVSQEMYLDVYAVTMKEHFRSIVTGEGYNTIDYDAPLTFSDQPVLGDDSWNWDKDYGDLGTTQKKHEEITGKFFQDPNQPDPSLATFEPGQAVVSYTMGTSAANKGGWDAALHRDLILMGEEEFSNLHRNVPTSVAEDYVKWYKQGWLQPGDELPHSRVMSFTALDKPGASPYYGSYYKGVEIWGTKVPGTYVAPVSIYPGENEVIVKKFTKLVIERVEEVGDSLRIYVTRKVVLPEESTEQFIKRSMQKGGALVPTSSPRLIPDAERVMESATKKPVDELGETDKMIRDQLQPEASKLKGSIDLNADPVVTDVENQLNARIDKFRKEYADKQAELIEEYKANGKPTADTFGDVRLETLQAEVNFDLDMLRYKAFKRIQEVTGTVAHADLNQVIDPAKIDIKEYGKYLPPEKQKAWQDMLDDYISIKGSKEKLPKYSYKQPVPQQQVDPELQKYQDVLDNQNSTLAEVESAWSEVGDMPASPEVRNLSKALEEKYNKLAEGADLRSDYTEANRSWATDAVSGAEDEQGVEEIISEMQKYYKLTDADVSELRAVKAEQTTKTAKTQAVSNLDLQGTLDNINTQRSKVIAERESLGVATGKQKARAEELDTARDWLERIQDHVASRPSLAETMLPSINQAVDDLDIDLMNDIWTKLSSSPRESKGFSVTRAATQESVPKQAEVEQTKPMFADAFGNEMTPLQKYTDSSAKFYDNPEWQEPLQEYLQKFPVESAPEAVRVLPKPASDALKKRINSGNLGVGDILPRSNNVQSWGVTDPAFSWSALDLPNRVKLFAKDLPSIRVPDSEAALKNKKEFITLPDLELRITKIEKVDDGSIHVTVEPVRKVNPVPQQQVIEQQIQTTDKAGDLQMSGKKLPLEQGNALTDAWQAGVDWFKDAYNDMVGALSDKALSDPVAQPIIWLHGTNVNDDVRRFLPENGSGTHELGIGLYLTDSEQVAEAAAKKFRYENTPVNMNYEVGDATIRELSDVNIESMLNLNKKIGKKQFMGMFADPLPHNPADVQDFYKYWKSNTDNSIGSVFDSYREWYSERWGIDELAVRQFQVDVFNKFRLEYDAGVHTAPNGVRTMVVYNPDKLTNSGVRFVDKAEGVDETLEALEARRFLDHQAEVAMGSDTRKVVRLQSESDLTTYQKQKASEALAEELVNQAEATKNITEADETLRETVRKAEDEKINKVEEAVEKGDADSVPVESPKHKVSEVLGSRNSYHKFRDKLGQKLDKKLKRLDKLTGNTKVKQKLTQEIDELVKQLDNVDTYVYHQQRIFEAVQHEPVRGDWKDLLSTILHQVDGHIIDPDWWKHRGNYKWDKAFQQASEGFNSIIAKFVSNYLGGDIGKVQRELHNLKRVGRGDFALRLAQREASQRVSRVQKEVKQMLKQFNLSEHDFGRLFHDVAELQTSKYIMDEAFADSKVAHYLSNKLNTQFSYFINEMGIPLDVMEDVALKVQEIPQVYKEVKQLADELGINFGDEVSLGYIPRQTKKTTEFWMKDATQADFTKSRQAFHWIPEDSKVVEAVLDAHNKHWKKRMSESLGREIKHFDDLLDSDSTILQAVIGYMNDDVIDFLNDMGIMRKIPFTASESAEFIAKKYDLPFKGIADVYITDPKRAMEMYTRGLTNKAGRNMTAFGFTEMPAFTKNIEDMTAAEKEVFTVPFMEALPDALKGSLPDDFTKLVEPLYVHPLVARELEAMYHTTMSAGVLAQIGDTLSLIYKYQSSQMLASGGWLAYQLIGNSMNLVKRNINPASFFDFQVKRVHAAATGKQIMDLMDDTKKVYGKGAFTQKEVAQQALRFGLIDSDATFLGSSSPRPSVFNYSDPSTWGNAPKEIQRSLTEFIAFTFRLKGHQEDFPSAGGYFGGLIERLQSGVDTVIDHTTMKYVDTFNKLTDDGYKFALFEAVLRDNTLPIPGLRFASGIPHFTGKDAFRQAAEYVRDNSFMFDETSGAAGEQAMRYVIPFWSFHRLNIGETARWIASNPFKFGNWLRLANSLQADFEEDDSAQWESLQSNKWFDNNFTIPIRIKADRSQSGTDEVWTLPGAQIFPSAGALQATDSIRELVSNIPGVNIPKFKFDYGEGELRPSQSDVNPMSKGDATFVQREGSPFLKTLLSFLDENYLFDYDLSAGYEMDKDYALGMDKKQYALFKLWLRPMANLLNAMPTQLMGRAPSLNRATGEYKEGERSVFTGQYPHWTSANTPNFFGEGVFSDFLKNMKLQPMPFDTYINQEYTISNITNQVYQAKDMMEKVRKELATTKPDDTAKIERLQQRAQETTLLYVHLQSEYEIYRQWRKLNNIPHPKAAKRIIQENLKVSDLLPEQERERIYKANWDKYMNYFTY